MAYQIDRYNRTLLTVVEDGTLDETTDLRFIGKNFAGYGEIHNENFLFLLENFSNASPPPRPLSGQLWFDSQQRKMKFFDGTIWRSTGGSQVANSQPAGLSVGDFWWDSANDQLYVFNGSSFVLIGPQDAGQGVTQLVSRTVTDTANQNRSVIVAVVNDTPVFVISRETTSFTLSDPTSSLPGFTVIHPGVTLKDTPETGETSSNFRFWGTASSAEKLEGRTADDFIEKDTPDFPNQITSDNGIRLTQALELIPDAEDNTHGRIQNLIPGGEIRFASTESTGGLLIHSVSVTPEGLVPALFETTSGSGINVPTYNLGSQSLMFKNVWAETINGTATKAESLKLKDSPSNSAGYELTVTSTSNTVVARDGNAEVFAAKFNGLATSAQYADLAEKYTTDKQYPVGTIMTVGGNAETTSADASSIAIGVISEKPAYLMNSEINGQAIALKGRVPVRVVGSVEKGKAVYASKDGVGSTHKSTAFVGVALESSTVEDEKLIECVLKV